VLVPSLMHLIGKSNWWLPKWLDRVIPHVSVEAGDISEPVLVDAVPYRSTQP